MGPRLLAATAMVGGLLAGLVVGCGEGSEAVADCERSPLVPSISASDATTQAWPDRQTLSGPVTDLTTTGSALSFAIDQTTIDLDLVAPIELDLAEGQMVDAQIVESVGSGGSARGLRLDDADGPVLLVEDGGYGPALEATQLEPFEITSVDINCRNRTNQPGDLNNFALRVESVGQAVELVNGEQGALDVDGQTYQLLVGRSVAAVDDVTWTDAPNEHVSFVIARQPRPGDGDRRDRPTDDQPTALGDAESGWVRLDDPPLTGRTGAVVVEVDQQLFIAGGWDFLCPPGADCAGPANPPFADGARFDPDTGRWEPVADAPLGFRNAASAVIGSDVYILSQCTKGPDCPAGRSLLRYRSADDSWDVLAAPSDGGFYDLMVFDETLVAYSRTDELGPFPDHRLDDNEVWQLLPDDGLPRVFDRQLVALDGLLYSWGSPIDGERPLTVGAVLDPASESWSSLPPGDGGFQVWAIGNRFYLNPHFGPSYGGGVFDAETGWQALPDPPTAENWIGDMAGVYGDRQANYEAPEGWVLDATTATWVEVPPRPLAAGIDAIDISDVTVTAVENQLVVFGGQSWSGGNGELLNQLWVWTPPGDRS